MQISSGTNFFYWHRYFKLAIRTILMHLSWRAQHTARKSF